MRNRTLQRALALDPALPLREQHDGAGSACERAMRSVAETHFREAIRMQPDLAEAHNNLGNLLAGRKAYAEAAHHFEQAIASNPNYVEARHSHGMVLALMRSYPRAVAELRSGDSAGAATGAGASRPGGRAGGDGARQ